VTASRPSGEPPRLARFRVLRELGGGAQGSVHEAIDLERDLPVALKTLRMLGAEEIARFKVEFRAVRDLRHPNLVSLGDLIEDAGRWFFTMELVRGKDFLAHVRADGVESLDESTSWPAHTRAPAHLRREHARRRSAQPRPARLAYRDRGFPTAVGADDRAGGRAAGGGGPAVRRRASP
jgi:serine/threonine protein kinase